MRQGNELRAFLFWGSGILFGGMAILIGFVIWDRRTVLEPVSRKSRELEEREEKVGSPLRAHLQKGGKGSPMEDNAVDLVASLDVVVRSPDRATCTTAGLHVSDSRWCSLIQGDLRS